MVSVSDSVFVLDRRALSLVFQRAPQSHRRREGAREGRWTLLDYVDIVVHIQHQDERNFYALDRLWRDCPTVPVHLDVDEPLAQREEDSGS